MKKIIKILGLAAMAATPAALSSAPAAAAASFKDGDIIYSDDFENSTPTNNMTFTGTTMPLNYGSVMGPNGITSTCMVIPNVAAKSGSGAYAVFSFPPADISALSPSYIEISGWASAINVATATVNGGFRLVVKVNNSNVDLVDFTPNKSNAVPWQKFVRLVPIKGATSIVLNLGFWEAGGTAWFDNIKIKLVKKIPTDSYGNYAGAYQQYYTGHPGSPVGQPPTTFFRGMHHSDTFFRSQTAQEGLEVLGGKWNANIIRWMLEGPIGSSGVDNLYTLNYDNGPVTYISPKGITTPYNSGTYWNILDDALARLDEALKYAPTYGLKVVVNLSGLSGGLFESKANQDKFVQVWQYIANRYKNSPYSNAIYGYDLANEPFIDGGWQRWTGAPGVLVWDDLAEKTAQAINAIDMTKTIFVEPWKRGPYGFAFQVPINAANVVYSVHMYKPNPFTGQTGFTGTAGSFDWPYPNYDMAGDLAVVRNFQTTYNAHIYVGEFSATRWAGRTAAVPPAEKTAAYNYIKDCTSIFEAYNWDWTFFGFMANGWGVEMDDNIGTYSAGFYSSSLRSIPNLREQHLRGYFAKNRNPYNPSSPVSLPLTSLTINSVYPYSNWYVDNQFTSSTTVKLKLSGVLAINDANKLNGYYLANNNTPPTAASAWYNVAASTFFFDNGITHTLTGGNGPKTVYAWFKNNSGNIYGPVTDTIDLDASLSGKIKPAIAITEPTTMPAYRTAQPINLRVIVSTENTSLATLTYSTPTYTINGTPRNFQWALNPSPGLFFPLEDRNEWTANPILNSGNNVIVVTVKDSQGNTSTDTINITYSPITYNGDPVKPQGTIDVNSGSAYANTAGVTLNLSAADNVGVAGYYASESPTAPTPSQTGWVSISPVANYSANVPFTLTSGNGTKTVYVWFKDAAGNISNWAAAVINLNLPNSADTTAPTVVITSPAANSIYSSTQPSINIMGTAWDNVAVSSVAVAIDGSTYTLAVGTASWTFSLNPAALALGTHTITARAVDTSGNAASTSINLAVNNTDITPPTISNISSSGLTDNSAVISWTTDENSDSQVEYGLTNLYGQSTTLSSALVTSHTVNLTGLSPNTAYHYRVKSRDAAGNPATSPDNTFTTALQPQASESWKNWYAIAWRDTPANSLKYAKQMGYEYIALGKGGSPSVYKNDPNSAGMKYYWTDPYYINSLYGVYMQIDASSPSKTITFPKNINPYNPVTGIGFNYTQAQKDWYSQHMVWGQAFSTSVAWPNNLATWAFWDFQQQAVIDEVVNGIISSFPSYENQTGPFTFAGYMLDVPALTGMWSKNGQTVTLAAWTGKDSGDTVAQKNYFSSLAIPVQITHEYSTYSDGMAAFYKQLNARMKQQWSNAKFIAEPGLIYNPYDQTKPWTLDDYVWQASKRGDRNSITPDFLSEEWATTDFVDDFSKSVPLTALSSMSITKSMVGSSQSSEVDELINRRIAAKAGVNGAWFNWFGRFGGAGGNTTMPDFQSITQVYPRLKLIRLIPNWDNLNGIYAASRSWNTSLTDPVYDSYDANNNQQSHIDKDVMYSRHWKTGQLFAVFNTNTGVGKIKLKPGETVASAARVNKFFEDELTQDKDGDGIIAGDGSSDVTITKNTLGDEIRLSTSVVIDVDTSNGQVKGNGYIFTLNVAGSSDTTPPSVSIASPADGSAVSGLTTIKGAASDNVAVSSVAISVDGAAYSLATGTASWTFSLNPAALALGTHTITARAVDTSGNAASGVITLAVSQSTAAQFSANIRKFSQFPLRGTWGLAGGIFSDLDSDIINNPAQLSAVINQYQKYGLNAAMIRYDDLFDINRGSLTANGKNFLSQMAANAIKVIINLNPGGQSFIDGTWVNSKPQVRSFLLSLNQYRIQNPNGYDNILTLFLCSDVGSQRVANVKLFADFIRNEVYNSTGAISRQLDIPLMVDTSNRGNITPTNSLDQSVEAVGVYNYPLLSRDDNSLILKTEQANSLLPDGRFFTFTQVHDQQWYNVLFYNNNNYNSDPLPEGVQIASELYQNLKANVKKSMLYIAPYLKTASPIDYSQDRLAEIGLFNKLIAPLVGPVLGSSSLNPNAGTVSDSTGAFSGSILNFTDTNGNVGALLVMTSSVSKTNYILGNSSAQNVSFDLKNSGLNLAGSALKAVEIRFPDIRMLPFSVSGPDLFLTIPSVYDNAMVLITSDQNLVNQVDLAVKSEQSNALNLFRESFLGRLRKTAKEISDMQNAGFALTASEQSILSSLAAATNTLNSMTYDQIRSAISQIGDFQLFVYKRVHNIAGGMPAYPDANTYSGLYYSLGAQQFLANRSAYLASCDPQKFHFYLLSEYISQPCDAVPPAVSILAPTAASAYTAASATLGLSGAASDNVGVSSVTWSNSATGASGAAAGTTSWSIGGISLASGTNIITVTAKDAANNASTDTITVTYAPGGSPVITSSLSVVGTVGTGLSYQIAAANSPSSFNATGLPAGLSVSTATGRISGTPATVGISSVTISAINAGGAGSAGLALSVYSACDLNRDWSANVADVQLQVNQALGFAACASDLNGDGLCNVADVQRGVVAGMGGPCVLGP